MSIEDYEVAKKAAIDTLCECIELLDNKLPENDEEVQDKIRDVLDQLTGWCGNSKYHL